MSLNNISFIRGLAKSKHLYLKDVGSSHPYQSLIYTAKPLSTTSSSRSITNSSGISPQQQTPSSFSSLSSRMNGSSITTPNASLKNIKDRGVCNPLIYKHISLSRSYTPFSKVILRHYSTSTSNNNTNNSSNNNNNNNENNNNNSNDNNSNNENKNNSNTNKNKYMSAVGALWDKIKYFLTRHKPLTSDQMFAIFSWLLFGTGSLVIVGTTTLVSLILWVANTFEFSEWIANKIGKYLTNNTGITITFEQARGELKTGYISIENVNVSRRPRADEHLSSIQLSIKRIDIKLSLLWMLEGKGIIQECLLSGVRGLIDRRTEGVYVNKDYIYPRKKKAQGDFVFEKLEVKDLLITYFLPDRTHRPLSISIYHLESDRFRKQWLLLDLLSCKSIIGKFDNSLFTFTIPQHQTFRFIDKQSSTLDNGNGTSVTGNNSNVINELLGNKEKGKEKFEMRELKIDGVNMDILSRNATGPLGWIKEGTFDIQLQILLPRNLETMEILESESIEYGIIPTDEDPSKNIHLSFKVQLNHLYSVAPLYTPEISYISNALAHPIVAYINSHSKHIPLSFSFSMNLRQFNGSWTPSQACFWDYMGSSVYEELANKVKETKNVTTLKKVATDLINDIIQWLVPHLQDLQYHQQEKEEFEREQQLYNQNSLEINNLLDKDTSSNNLVVHTAKQQQDEQPPQDEEDEDNQQLVYYNQILQQKQLQLQLQQIK
ncbi:hypothetical protein CYY_007456 [Polysphondylium violaceum]|uniref:Uncharacterized protein n=1 Tax=Polysphondylium violaceum TaxID=133409 RepID=A0A8J4V269_9MYCE|nr:hypothetical protein CYY_007456 [Polysphondylium violaceum]